MYFNTSKVALVATFTIGGFFGTSYFPLCFSYGAEMTFPVQPALINGTMTLTGALLSVIIGIIASFLARERDSDLLLEDEELLEQRRFRGAYVCSTMCIATLIAFVLNFFIKEDLRRLNFGKEENAFESTETVPVVKSTTDTNQVTPIKLELADLDKKVETCLPNANDQ